MIYYFFPFSDYYLQVVKALFIFPSFRGYRCLKSRFPTESESKYSKQKNVVKD